MECSLLYKKKGCLFALFVCHVENLNLLPNDDSSCNVFDTIGKLSTNMGVLSLIHNISAYGGKVNEH